MPDLYRNRFVGKSIPSGAMSCLAELEILKDAPSESDKPWRCNLIANSGEPHEHWFWGRMVVNMSGLRTPRKSFPILRDHDASRPVGKGEAAYVDQTQRLRVDALMSASRDDAKEIRALQDEIGFPWQASLSVENAQVMLLEEGQSREVNGRVVDGPMAIWDSSDLREVSICTLGADANTGFSESAQGETKSVKLSWQEEPAERSDAMPPVVEEEKVEAPAAETKPVEVPVETPAEKPAEVPVDVASLERGRCEEITKKCLAFGYPEMAAGFIKDGSFVHDVSEKLAEKVLEAKRSASINPGPNTETPVVQGSGDVIKDEWEKDESLRLTWGNFNHYAAYRRAKDKGCKITMKHVQ